MHLLIWIHKHVTKLVGSVCAKVNAMFLDFRPIHNETAKNLMMRPASSGPASVNTGPIRSGQLNPDRERIWPSLLLC